MGMEREYDFDRDDTEVSELNAEAVALLKRYGIRGRAGFLVHIDEHGRYTFLVAKGISVVLDSAVPALLEVVDSAVAAGADLEKAKHNGRLN